MKPLKTKVSLTLDNDLALLQQAPLEPEAMTKFVARSNEIMMLLTK